MSTTIGRRGQRLNLVLRRGATIGPFTLTLQGADENPIDLIVAAEVRAKVRKDPVAAQTYPFVCQIIDEAGGKIQFEMAPEVSATVPYLGPEYDPDNQYIWDLEIEFTDGRVMELLWGTVKVVGEATV